LCALKGIIINSIYDPFTPSFDEVDSELNDAFQELKIRQKDIQKDLNLLAQQLDRNSRAKEKDK